MRIINTVNKFPTTFQFVITIHVGTFGAHNVRNTRTPHTKWCVTIKMFLKSSSCLSVLEKGFVSTCFQMRHLFFCPPSAEMEKTNVPVFVWKAPEASVYFSFCHFNCPLLCLPVQGENANSVENCFSTEIRISTSGLVQGIFYTPKNENYVIKIIYFTECQGFSFLKWGLIINKYSPYHYICYITHLLESYYILSTVQFCTLPDLVMECFVTECNNFDK